MQAKNKTYASPAPTLFFGLKEMIVNNYYNKNSIGKLNVQLKLLTIVQLRRRGRAVGFRRRYYWASEASPTWTIHLRFFIGASAAKPHMDDTSGIFHILSTYVGPL